jgi:hypothetical protein
MREPQLHLLELNSRSQYNRDCFLLNFRDEYNTFTLLLEQYEEALKVISTNRDLQNLSHIGLIPHLLFAQRSIMHGFDNLMPYQSFFAWSNFRTGLEAMLIVGKFVNNPGLAEVWTNHGSNKKNYINEFQKELDKNNSLPKCKEFRKLLSTINTHYLHPNPTNILSNTSVSKNESNRMVGINMRYFDDDSDLHEAYVHAYIRIFSEIDDSLAEMIGLLYRGQAPQKKRAAEYQTRYGSRVAALIQRKPEAKDILIQFGLWSSL